MVFPLPTPPAGLVASPEEIAAILGTGPTLTPTETAAYQAAIWRAQATLEGHLNRPVTPVTDTRTGLTPTYGEPVTSWRAWAGVWDDDITVTTATLGSDGKYAVTVTVGIDVTTIPRLRAWVVEAAADDLRTNQPTVAGAPGSGRAVSSVSVEGQSVSYEKSNTRTRTAPSDPSSDPRFRGYVRPGPVYVRSTSPRAPWPHTGILGI